ncbi:MAG: methylamine dehydrogenase [Proteobacteria bacterium]|nr:methylamine dehydrogenase [Pseudomonadota bacterium]
MSPIKKYCAKNPAAVSAAGAALVALLAVGQVANAAQDSRPPPLPIEPTDVVESLPRDYPPNWFLVHDVGFFHMSDGKVYILDSAAETSSRAIKGMFNVSYMGNLAQSARRGEIYATEAFHPRGTRGDRIDVLTIWDTATLTPKGEVMLRPGKRLFGMPERYAVVTLDNDRFLAIANFSPATSATIIDLDTREIVAEIPTPGCSLVYPTGKLGFSSLCADGRFMSTELNTDGTLLKQTRTDSFFSSDDNPIYERPAVIDGIAYFPSIAGLVYPVDVRGKVAEVGEAWSLVSEQEREQNWAPGGIVLIDRDDQGRFYVIMHADAKDGSYQGGGSEVWVFDAVKKQRVMRIALREWGLSLGLSRGKNPVLMVVNPMTMSLEMYNTESGEFISSIDDFGQETPLMMTGSK